MAELFLLTKEKVFKSMVFQKRQFFQVEIRQKIKDQRKKQLRSLTLGMGPHIKTLVDSLPTTLPEIQRHLNSYPQTHKMISKMIIDQMYNSQSLSQPKSKDYQIFQLQPPDSVQYLKKELWLFLILLKNQGKHAAQLFKRYSPILKDHCLAHNVPHLLFDLLTNIANQRQLNWIPIDEVISIIQMVQNSDSAQITNEQVECYFNLSNHYYSIIKDIPEIKTRIQKILQKGSQCFKFVKPKNFFKLCLTLTFNEGKQEASKQVGKQGNKVIELKSQLNFHKSMIQGSLVKSLYRQILYSSSVSMRLLCLKILGNLLIELKSSFVWQSQKENPIQEIQNEIKEKGNSMQMFYAFCQVFLLSINNVPFSQVRNFIENQFERFSSILYILENVDENSHGGQYVKQLAEECLWFVLENGCEQQQIKLANMLIERDWKNVLGHDSEIILHCYQVLNIQS